MDDTPSKEWASISWLCRLIFLWALVYRISPH
jgi:hypothetical protein